MFVIVFMVFAMLGCLVVDCLLVTRYLCCFVSELSALCVLYYYVCVVELFVISGFVVAWLVLVLQLVVFVLLFVL